MTIAYFSTSLPDLSWVEVGPSGEATIQDGPLDATILRNLLGGTPEQVRSPWEATVFIRTDPGAGQPINWLATMILRQSLTPGQQVRGPMVVLGPVDDDGEVTPADETLVGEVISAVAKHRGTQ